MTCGPRTHSSPGSPGALGGHRHVLARFRIDQSCLGVGHEWADGGAVDVVAGLGGEVHGRAGLGHAVPLGDDAVEPARHRRRQRAVEGSGAGEDHLHRREIVLVDDRMLGQCDGDRGRDEHPGRAVLRDDAEELGQIELRHRDESGALAEREVQQHGHPVDVEEGEHGEEPIARRDTENGPALRHVGHEVPMREHHALGSPGRAGGVGRTARCVAGSNDTSGA